MTTFSKDSVHYLTIDDEQCGQRIDNYLIRILKGVPKSHIYRIIRSGEVRANKGRIDATYKIQLGDIIRVPPIRIAEAKVDLHPNAPKADFPIVYEDDVLLVINKPAGVAVHGGSGISFGVIEQLRKSRPEARYLELVHRLDRETSGLLMIAKKRSALVKLHEMIRQDIPQKKYLALSCGLWPEALKNVKLPLHRFHTQGGERMVRVDEEQGIYAHTIFSVIERFVDFTLVQAHLRTGRTHQIRVHMQASGFPIAHDEKYGQFDYNKHLKKLGLKRMFLHAYQLSLPHPVSGEPLKLEAPLPKELNKFLESLRK